MSTHFDEKTVIEQNAFEEYKRIEAENFHLKRQLANKNKDIKRLKHIIRVYKGKEEQRNRKPHFKNGKRGTQYGNRG